MGKSSLKFAYVRLCSLNRKKMLRALPLISDAAAVGSATGWEAECKGVRLSLLVPGRIDPDAAKGSLRRVGELFADDAVDLKHPVVAQELERPAAIGIDDHRLGIEMMEVNVGHRLGLGFSPVPLKEAGVVPGVVGTGDDEVAVVPVTEVAHAQPAEIKQERIAEPGGFARDQVVGVEERDDQGPALRDRIAKADQQVAVGGRAEALDVEGVGRFGRAPARGVQLEGAEAGIAEEVGEQVLIRLAGSDQLKIAAELFPDGREEEVAIGAEFPLMIPAVRGDPKNPVAQPGGGLQVGLRLLAIHAEKTGQLDALDRRAALIGPVNADRVVLVVGHGEQFG